MLPIDLRPEYLEDRTPLTFNITYRYSDERDYRLFACGVETLVHLRSLVSELAGYAGIEDIRITYDNCYTDFKEFTL